MLNDHYPRIHALHQQAIENAEMEQLEKRVAPLLLAVLLIIFAVIFFSLANGIDAFVSHYNGLTATNDALAQCMNGHPISLGDAELKCDVREYKKLASGLAQGDQP